MTNPPIDLNEWRKARDEALANSLEHNFLFAFSDRLWERADKAKAAGDHEFASEMSLAAQSIAALIAAQLELTDIESGVAPCGISKMLLSELRAEWDKLKGMGNSK